LAIGSRELGAGRSLLAKTGQKKKKKNSFGPTLLSPLTRHRYNVGFDIDPDAIAIAQENCEEFEIEMDFILTDLSATPAPATTDGEPANARGPYEMMKGKLDTILMNPPFGTKLKGIDMVFLKKGIDVRKHRHFLEGCGPFLKIYAVYVELTFFFCCPSACQPCCLLITQDLYAGSYFEEGQRMGSGMRSRCRAKGKTTARFFSLFNW